MTEVTNNTTGERTCPQCGMKLPPNVMPELCPRCLLKSAQTGTEQLTEATGQAARGAQVLSPGQQFGHYMIVRTLGGGGMGTVFEAEDLENGRRVALKVLSQGLDSPDARERFFREGRLAASINHPNSIYIFGTEEIAGTPVISMELASGGTLQDRVGAKGPLPCSEAVDAALQIVAGLEAAQRAGILHRDVKPSNCFVEMNGVVKIGDFGLSISTAVRTEPALTASGAFLGTPSFCSPEQLRGEELNARSDMYAVGATLFYLLTGRTPFEAKNVVALIATVLEQPAPSPRRFRQTIPTGLATVVQQCLQKDPGERFRSYEELRRALQPFSSTAPAPATLGHRFVAGCLDFLGLNFLVFAVMLLGFGDPLRFVELGFRQSPLALAVIAAAFSVSVLYYAVSERFWGATLGKALCRLRVVTRQRNTPSFGQTLLRALIYVLVPMIPFWIAYGRNVQGILEASGPLYYAMSLSVYIIIGLFFVTARRLNGFASVYDIITSTRVISIAGYERRVEPAPEHWASEDTTSARKIGPYHVLQSLPSQAPFEWLLGYDLRLLRRVWIRTLPPGTAAFPSELRNLSRIARLRWLAGKRSSEENWDAFESPSGHAFVSLLPQPQSWANVRFWIHDLAEELRASIKDGTRPRILSLGQVWITAENRVKLLDFPAPGVASDTEAQTEGTLPPLPSEQSDQVFLSRFVRAALTGHTDEGGLSTANIPIPLPLHARDFLQKLPQAPLELLPTMLRPVLHKPATISRVRRGAVVAACAAFPILFALMSTLGIGVVENWNSRNPEVMQLSTVLQSRWAARLFSLDRAPSDEHYGIYIASQYGSFITNRASWTSPFALMFVRGSDRTFAAESVVRFQNATPEQVQNAKAAVSRVVPKPELAFSRPPMLPALVAVGGLGVYVALPALIAALGFRGGVIQRIAAITFVRKDGSRASRFRIFCRGLVAWSAVMLPLMFGGLDPNRLRPGFIVSAVLVLLVTGLSVALPARGLQDRLAGTWPVPR